MNSPNGHNLIEDYALIGDTHTAALVSREGSIDWFCAPRFDSDSMFAALVGDADNGRWLITPKDAVKRMARAYRTESLVLETTFECENGTATLIDTMVIDGSQPRILRVVEGQRGRVQMRLELIARFAYGDIVPWVRTLEGAWLAIAGPDALVVYSDVPLIGKDLTTVAEFEVGAGDRVSFQAVYHASHEPRPGPVDPHEALDVTHAFWSGWAHGCRYEGPARDAVVRSLITLKALTFRPTGAVVASPTTSLPEKLGGVRNWDYRYCWLRDATFVLLALHNSGYDSEAEAWRVWLLRAVAGAPDDLQIMYGLRGERRIPEFKLPWLKGYANSQPVRLGNAAVGQFQLDVYGEVIDALYQSHRTGTVPDVDEWNLAKAVIATVEERWSHPDHGLWEVRGRPRHFTHSKVMAWVAIDRAIKAVENFGLEGPVERWRPLRDTIHEEVCRRGYDTTRQTFTQYYGSRELDASVLLIPTVGFLEPTDPRVASTIVAVERELLSGGLLQRYTQRDADHPVDGLPPGEGAFLACSFWLADAYAMTGRMDDAHHLFERLLSVRNDLGLLAEEYDTQEKRLLGNFPQAFSHVGLVTTAYNISQHEGPSEQRSEQAPPGRFDDAPNG